MTKHRDTHDTPVEVNTLASKHAADPIDMTDMAIAEELAVSGPADSDLEATPIPVRSDGCQECGGALSEVGEWRAPADAGEAWAKWRDGCCISRARDPASTWTFCPVNAVAWINGERHDFERRKISAKPRKRQWSGPERRRPRLAPLRLR